MKNSPFNGNLTYLYNKPKTIWWEVIAGPIPSPIQMYDIVYDQHDMKIRFPNQNRRKDGFYRY